MLPRRTDHCDGSPCISFLGNVARVCCCLPLPRRYYSSASPPSAEQSLLHTSIRPVETAGATATTAAPALVEVSAEEATTGRTLLPPSSERQMLLSPKQQANQSGTVQQSLKLKEETDYELEDDSNLCPTCLEPFTADNPRIIARCGHQYHLPCIYEWLERSENCPMCGKKMEIT